MDLDFYTKNEIGTMLGGIVFKKISLEEFNALLIKDPDCIYYVYDENGKVTQYMGSVSLGGGNEPSTASLSCDPTGAFIIGSATKEE